MSSVVFDGVLKIKLSDEQISFIEQLELPPEAVRLKNKYLHVTLIHQSFLKPYKTILKNSCLDDLSAPEIVFADGVEVRVDEELGRKSWVLWLENQEEMCEFVKTIMNSLTGESFDPEPERRYHVSVANLTGNRSDSVR
ncbi:hypothetical protein EBR25_13345 [bacterium]|nr:hypothetical protein [bacterium]